MSMNALKILIVAIHWRSAPIIPAVTIVPTVLQAIPPVLTEVFNNAPVISKKVEINILVLIQTLFTDINECLNVAICTSPTSNCVNLPGTYVCNNCTGTQINGGGPGGCIGTHRVFGDMIINTKQINFVVIMWLKLAKDASLEVNKAIFRLKS